MLREYEGTVAALADNWKTSQGEIPSGADARRQQLISVLAVAMHGPVPGSGAIERWWRGLQETGGYDCVGRCTTPVVAAVDEMMRTLVLEPEHENNWSRSCNELKPQAELEQEPDKPRPRGVGSVEEFCKL